MKEIKHMNDSKLSQSEYSFLEQTLLEKIRSWKADQARIAKEIETAEATLKKLRGYTVGTRKSKALRVDESFDDFVAIYRETENRWLAQSFVMEQYRLRTGKELSKYQYQKNLKGNGKVRFEKRGEKRFAVWRIIDNDNAN
jgi:hypothetical protein